MKNLNIRQGKNSFYMYTDSIRGEMIDCGNAAAPTATGRKQLGEIGEIIGIIKGRIEELLLWSKSDDLEGKDKASDNKNKPDGEVADEEDSENNSQLQSNKLERAMGNKEIKSDKNDPESK